MSGWFTDDNGELHRFAGGSGFKSALPIGAIFASAIPLTDSSVHLLDGSTISQTGIYEQFAVYIKSLRDSGYKITCTQSEFDTSVSTYGQCGKFVIDDNTKTIRLPKITEFIASNNDGQEIGLAQLDSFKSHNHTMQSAGNHKHSTSFTSYGTSASWSSAKEMYTTTASGKNAGSESRNTSETGSHTHTIDNTGSSETRPKNIRYPYYIVLANGFEDVVCVSGGSSGGGADYDDTEIREQIQELQGNKADKTELNDYVTKDTAQIINGEKKFKSSTNSYIWISNVFIQDENQSYPTLTGSVYPAIYQGNDTTRYYFILPNKSGTVALKEDVQNAVVIRRWL